MIEKDKYSVEQAMEDLKPEDHVSSSRESNKETYRSLGEEETAISDKEQKEKTDPEKRESMVRENDQHDGADEKMLGAGDGERLAAKELEIKFISGAPGTNGDAQIDIGNVDKVVLTGLTKEELMRYANDPFWVKLRWFLFIAFWALWVGMLVGAIYIIVQTPKCLPPEPHTWYKQGPLVSIDTLAEPTQEILEDLKNYGVSGVIYKLPADETYSLKSLMEVQKIADAFKGSETKVILDVTATYVPEDDPLFQEALSDRNVLNAFVFTEAEPPNWRAFEGGLAFHRVREGLNVLGQYGKNRYDLRMDNPLVKEKFKEVLRKLAEAGVQGIRLDRSRHFIIDSELTDESPNHEVTEYQSDQYHFWTHTHTALRDGLGQLLAEYRDYFKNVTNGDGFLSTVDDIARPEVYLNKEDLGVDVPRFGRLDFLLNQTDIPIHQLRKELEDNERKMRSYNSWPQFPYTEANFKTLNASEYTIFTYLLPGVPVTTLDALKFGNSSVKTVEDLENTRKSPSCMHGSFDVETDSQTVAYTRYKSGNPGYLVVLNPNPTPVTANYTHIENMSPELKVHLLSENFRANSTLKTNDKVKVDSLNMPPKSVGVFSYVASN